MRFDQQGVYPHHVTPSRALFDVATHARHQTRPDLSSPRKDARRAPFPPLSRAPDRWVRRPLSVLFFSRSHPSQNYSSALSQRRLPHRSYISPSPARTFSPRRTTRALLASYRLGGASSRLCRAEPKADVLFPPSPRSSREPHAPTARHGARWQPFHSRPPLLLLIALVSQNISFHVHFTYFFLRHQNYS